MGTRIFLWASIIWVAPLLYFQMKNDAVFKKNIAVGVTLPKEAQEDEEIKRLLDKYKKQQLYAMIVLLIIGVVFFFVYTDFKRLMNSWCLWVDLCILFPCIPFVICNRDVKRIKEDRGWTCKSENKVFIDTKAIPEQKEFPAWIFVISALACLLPLVWDRTGFFLYIAFAVTDITFGLCCRFCLRNKADVVDENTELSVALTRIRRYNWGRVWIFSAASTAVLSILISFCLKSAFLEILVITLYTIILASVMFKIEFKVRHLQEDLTKDCGAGSYVDEDEYWICGLLYFNPNDRSLIVNNRSGIGSTLNFARPFAKFVAIAVAIILVLMPFTGTLTSHIGEAPIVLSCENGEFTAVYGSKTYMLIKEDEIDRAELLQTLPENLSRSWGTGADKLLKGSFTSDIGNLNICLDPTCPPYILITKKNGNKYLFGARSEAETLEVYDRLVKGSGVE